VTEWKLGNPLPRVTGEGRPADPPASALVPPRQYGLLVVDDDEGVRGVLGVGLRQQGFAVWLASGGREALDLYRQHSRAIDVVLLDVRMPGLDGPQTLAALQELNPQVCCCFMSGGLGSYTQEGLRDLGAAAVLPKPFRLPEVARVLLGLAGDANGEPAQRGNTSQPSAG
jgi:CheY-like chemotaxis protein